MCVQYVHQVHLVQDIPRRLIPSPCLGRRYIASGRTSVHTQTQTHNRNRTSAWRHLRREREWTHAREKICAREERRTKKNVANALFYSSWVAQRPQLSKNTHRKRNTKETHLERHVNSTGHPTSLSDSEPNQREKAHTQRMASEKKKKRVKAQNIS